MGCVKAWGTQLTGLARRNFLRILPASLCMYLTRPATALQAPRRRQLSFNLRSSEMRIVTVEQKTTYITTITLEAPTDALRVGLANITPTPYKIDGICCREVDAAEPGLNSPWAYVGFGAPGRDLVRPPIQMPQPCMVPGNSRNLTGATNVPSLIWSDWISYRTLRPSGRPQMQIRVLVPPQTLPLCYPAGVDVSRALPNSGVRVIRETEVKGDLVSRPEDLVSKERSIPYSPIAVVQYQSLSPGVQIVMGGDSHLSGWFNFVQLAAFRLSTPSLPIAVWNAAWGGQPSNTFWPALDTAIDAGSASIAVIEGWAATDTAYMSRIAESAARAKKLGAIPIILKGLPRNLFGTAGLAAWQQSHQGTRWSGS